MKQSWRWARLATVLLVLAGSISFSVLTATPAGAWCTSGITRWKYNVYTLHGRTSVPSGHQAAITYAMKQWNGIPSSALQYAGPQWNSQAPNPDFQISYISFSNVGLPESLPALAAGSDSGPRHLTTAVNFSTQWSWNTSGVMNQAQKKVDVGTVAVHEFGHASGLGHPYANLCGTGHPTTAEKASVMYVDFTVKRNTTADDKAGIGALY